MTLVHASEVLFEEIAAEPGKVTSIHSIHKAPQDGLLGQLSQLSTSGMATLDIESTIAWITGMQKLSQQYERKQAEIRRLSQQMDRYLRNIHVDPKRFSGQRELFVEARIALTDHLQQLLIRIKHASDPKHGHNEVIYLRGLQNDVEDIIAKAGLQLDVCIHSYHVDFSELKREQIRSLDERTRPHQ